MLTLSKLIPRGRGLAPALVRRAPSVLLDWDTRQKCRFEAQDSLGQHLGVFLPRGQVLRGGDVLVGEDGGLWRVEAAAQTLMRVRANPELAPPEAALALLRGAYHLGNRHVMLALSTQALHAEPDAVLADMLRGLGLEVVEVQAPFEPEAGAYGEHRHGHEHGHGHSH